MHTGPTPAAVRHLQQLHQAAAELRGGGQGASQAGRVDAAAESQSASQMQAQILRGTSKKSLLDQLGQPGTAPSQVKVSLLLMTIKTQKHIIALQIE